MIKVVGFVILLLSIIITSGHGSTSRGAFDRPLDEYSDLCWEDQKPRLDNLAIALQSNPTLIGDIIVYDGKRACRGEAVAQAIRAKKYLVEYRKVEAGRIVWRWGRVSKRADDHFVDYSPRGISLAANAESVPGRSDIRRQL